MFLFLARHQMEGCAYYKVIADNYIKRSRRLPQFTFAYIRPRLIIYADIKKFAYRAVVRRAESKF